MSHIIFPIITLMTFAVPVGFFGLIIWLVVGSRRRHDPSSVARLRAMGFVVDERPSRQPVAPFRELAQNRGTVNFRISRPDTFSTAFQYQYVTGFGQHEHVHRHSCALIALPFSAPPTSVKLGRTRFTSNRVESDSEEFNAMYDVISPDERFAYTLLSYELIAWLLRPPRLMYGTTMHLHGSWLLLVRSQGHELQLPELLGLAHAFRSELPPVLQSLYPQQQLPPPR